MAEEKTQVRGSGRDGGRRDQVRGGDRGRERRVGFQPYVDPEKERLFKALNIPLAMQRKVGLAMERNTRVILARSPYTHVLLDIVKQADRANKNMNNRVLMAADPMVAIGKFTRFKEAVEVFDEATAELCQAAGLPYVSPVKESRGGSQSLDKGAHGGDNGGDGKGEASPKARRGR